MIFFASVKLQTCCSPAPTSPRSRPGRQKNRRCGFGNLTSYQDSISDRTLQSRTQDHDRFGAVVHGPPDCGAKRHRRSRIISAPQDLKGEELGLKRLLNMGTILQIPQAGLATTDEKIKTNEAKSWKS